MMKYARTLITIQLLLIVCTLCARNPQRREVVLDTLCNAPLSEMCKVAERFCYEFQVCPDSLFRWAYLGLEEDKSQPKSKEGRDIIQLRYKDRTYDAETKVGDVTLDVYVLGTRFWKDQHLITHYTLTQPEYQEYPITSHLTARYSGAIIEEGDIILRMAPVSETQTLVHYEFGITFGKFLAAFLSDKTWRNGIEWRFETILENLVECAETGTVQPKVRGYRPQPKK